MLNKIKCFLFWHKRGKRTGISSDLGVQFHCPRCRAVWNRKKKEAR